MRYGILTCDDECHNITEKILSFLGFEVETIEWRGCFTWILPIDVILYADSFEVLSLAEMKGLEIVTTCNHCYRAIRDARQRILENPELLDILNEITAKDYKGFGNCRHIVDVLYNDVGVDVIRDFAENELDLTVTVHPGCKLLNEENASRILKRLCKALGVEVLNTIESCCGTSALRKGNAEKSLELARDLLDSSVDAVVTACSSCLTHLKMAQESLKRLGEIDFEIPVLHYVQLLAICMGLCSFSQFGWDYGWAGIPLRRENSRL